MEIENRKICFVLCSNDEMYEKECIYYISQLEIPEGYETEVLVVHDAGSITSGYNEAMKASNAKYKVYLHQDVFIVNKRMLYDMLEIFEDTRIGMIGMVGSPKLPEHGVMWYGDRVGSVYGSEITQSYLQAGEIKGEKINDVEAVDGLLMITQYDIPWREDLFRGWDFYDVSQSQEFLKQGYRVAVPGGDAWCIHDDGYWNLTGYYRDRKIFLENYRK